MIHNNGFKEVTIQKEKPIYLPDDILRTYLNEDELADFRSGKTGIYSVTVYAEKPKVCCGSNCCN